MYKMTPANDLPATVRALSVVVAVALLATVTAPLVFAAAQLAG